MTALNHKLLREFRAHLVMLLAVSSIITVGVAGLVAMLSSYFNLSQAMRLYYAQCRMADFSIELKKAPLSEISLLATWPEVAHIRPRIQQNVTVDIPGVVEPLSGLALSLPDQRQPVIDDIVIRQGGYFTDRRENEVIVNENFARVHRLQPGQWVRLLLNNRQQEVFIVGTAVSSEFIYLLGPGAITPDPEHFGVFYLKQSYAEDVFDFKGSANQVLGRLSAGALGNPSEVLRRAELALADYGVFTTTPLAEQPSNKFISQEIHGLKSIAVIMPSMFLVVAALVLNVLLSRLAQQQRTVMGTLKALGHSDRELSWHFLKFGLSVGLIGGLAGCGLGWWLASGMTVMYREFFQFPELYSRFHAAVHAAGMLISVGCAALGSLRGSRSVLRLQPAEAMRLQPPRRGGDVFIEHISWLWRRLGSAWRMVLRNMIRARLRTAACIFAAAMGTCVLVNSFMMNAAMKYLIDFQFRRIMQSDIDLAFTDEHGREALDEAGRLPGVDRAEPVLNVACTFFADGAIPLKTGIDAQSRTTPATRIQKKGTITGLAARASLTVPRDLAGRPLRIPSHGLLVNRTLAEILHVGVGDMVGMQPTKGQRRPRYVPVAEISDSYLGTAVYADIAYLSHLIDEAFAVSGAQLTIDSRRRDDLYRELKEMPALMSMNARADMIHNLEDTVLKNQGLVITILIVFAGTMFFGSILNTSLVSLAERQREIATLRVLGYGPWQVGSLLLRESMITTIVGTLLGMPLGYMLTVMIAKMYASDLFRMPVIAPNGLWALVLAIAVAFGLVTHLFVQRAVSKMDWLDALKVQE